MLADGIVEFSVGELRDLPLPGSTQNLCDFCQVGTPVWRYPARDTAMNVLVVDGLGTIVPMSMGDWSACHECAELVEAGDWPALARRALRVTGVAEACRGGPPGLRVRLLAVLSGAHARFREARTGEPRRLWEPG